jgi:hypothetical protein
MFLEDDDDKQHVSDTVEEIGEGVADLDAGQVGEAVKDDALQTKDDIGDAVLGEDGDNR